MLINNKEAYSGFVFSGVQEEGAALALAELMAAATHYRARRLLVECQAEIAAAEVKLDGEKAKLEGLNAVLQERVKAVQAAKHARTDAELLSRQEWDAACMALGQAEDARNEAALAVKTKEASIRVSESKLEGLEGVKIQLEKMAADPPRLPFLSGLVAGFLSVEERAAE